MRRVLWPIALLVTFMLGWAAAGAVRKAPSEAQDADAVQRLQQQVETLQARLRARDDLAASRSASAMAERRSAPAPRGDDRVLAQAVPRNTADAPAARPMPAASAASTVGVPAGAPSVETALDRFYKYLEAISEANGRWRWREARALVDELRAMGAPAGQALMQVLSAGNDSEERRAAARLLGQLQVAQALPLLRDVLDKEPDLLLRRAAASGLRQLQTPESIPVMERLLTQPAEDRFVRLSAAVGLADSGKPLGVAGLVSIFDESTTDGRGRELAFRALANLKDDRPLPFMRQVAGSQAEPGYRLQAIRYLSAQGDQQSLGTLNALMHSPTEQPSIRDAAAQAYAAIGGK